MKKHWLYFLAIALLTGCAVNAAEVIKIDNSVLRVNNRQPLLAIITDSDGNVYQRTVVYDPAFGGINMDLTGVGPSASIFFPELGTGFIWYNGYWVDESGYYWNGTRRVYVTNPQWRTYWMDYWRENRHDDWHGERWRRRLNERQDEWRQRVNQRRMQNQNRNIQFQQQGRGYPNMQMMQRSSMPQEAGSGINSKPNNANMTAPTPKDTTSPQSK